MKLAFFVVLLATASGQAHQMGNAGCKAIHDACTSAKQIGKANMLCAHDILAGKKIEGVTQDLTAEIKDCKSVKHEHEMMEHEMMEHETAPPAAK